ncbi:hypothetical protein ACFSTC_52605 [Nonomuraea ferruginea]
MTATARRPEAPEAPGQRSGRRGGSRLLNAAVGLVLLGAAIGLQSLDLSHNEYSAPLTYLGGKGENVDATRFVVRLNSVTAAKSIRHLSDTLKTDRLFLVVDVSAKSKLKPYKLGLGRAADRRRQEVLRHRPDRQFGHRQRQVGAARHLGRGSYFFEVPASVLARRPAGRRAAADGAGRAVPAGGRDRPRAGRGGGAQARRLRPGRLLHRREVICR